MNSNFCPWCLPGMPYMCALTFIHQKLDEKLVTRSKFWNVKRRNSYLSVINYFTKSLMHATLIRITFINNKLKIHWKKHSIKKIKTYVYFAIIILILQRQIEKTSWVLKISTMSMPIPQRISLKWTCSGHKLSEAGLGAWIRHSMDNLKQIW
jgi:hypothetical protein